jgi:hypothetical protein
MQPQQPHQQTVPWQETTQVPRQPQHPYLQQPPRRRRSPMKVILIVVGVLVGLFVALIVVAAIFGDPKQPVASLSSSASTPAEIVPAYEVVKTRRNGVDLLVPKATIPSAQAAIKDWIEQNSAGRDYLVVQVVRSADAKTYVCKAEYVADEQTSQIKTGGRVTGDFPATVMNCPDPAGS